MLKRIVELLMNKNLILVLLLGFQRIDGKGWLIGGWNQLVETNLISDHFDLIL